MPYSILIDALSDEADERIDENTTDDDGVDDLKCDIAGWDVMYMVEVVQICELVSKMMRLTSPRP